jgi:hypothetical protein
MHMRKKGHRCAMLLALLVVGLSSATAGGASAAGWLAPKDVPLSVSDLGFDEHGNAIAVGVGAGAGGGSAIQAITRPFGGQWSASVPVSDDDDSDVTPPQVAVNPHGDAVAIWSAHSEDAAKEVVRVASRPAGGAWSAPVVVSEGNLVFGRDVDVAIDAQGNATAIWTEILVADWLVRSSSRPSGGTWSAPADLSESAVAARPRLAVDAQGAVTAVWLGTAPRVGGGSVDVVRSNSRPADGPWSAGAVALSSEDGTGSASGPQLALDAQGTATAVWSLHSSSGDAVQATRREAGGWSATDDLGSGSSPQVAVDPEGNATAIWESSAPAGSVVLSSGRTDTGAWSNPAPMAAGDDADVVGYPWVAADPQGNVTAIWARYNSTDVIAQATRHVAGSFSWSPAVDLTVGQPITAIPAAGVDPQGHVSMVWSSSVDPWSGSSSVFDPVGPELRGLAVPATALVGQPVSMSGDPFDAWSAATLSWDFGDGQAASGAAVNHTYNSAGERTVTIIGTDAVGNTTQTSQRIVVSQLHVDPGPDPKQPGPGPGPGPGPQAPAPKAPVLSGLLQSGARWRTHSVKRGPQLPVGTTFRFKLDRGAQVRFAFSRIVAGRRAGGRCVKTTKNNRGKPRCDRSQAAGTLNVAGKAGANTVAFRGKLRGRTLAPGSYQLIVTASADGKTATAAPLRFTIAS